MKREDMDREVEKRSGLTLLDYPHRKSLIWFPLGPEGIPAPFGYMPIVSSADSGSLLPASRWIVTKTCPADDGMTVMYVFGQDDGSHHVYTWPSEDNSQKAPRRYVLPPHPGSCAVDSMTPDVWLEAVVNEWHAVAETDLGGELDGALARASAALDFLRAGNVEATRKELEELLADESDEPTEEEPKPNGPAAPMPVDAPAF